MRDGRGHRGERARHAVVVADRVEAEFAVRMRHRADEPHAARDAVEFACDEAAVGEDQVGTDHLRDVAVEAVLARQLDDVLRLPVVEVLGEERRDRPARAARVERVERTVERDEVGAQRLDLRQRRGSEPEGLGGDAPGNRTVLAFGNAEESRREVFDDVAAPLRGRHSGRYRRTGHVAL